MERGEGRRRALPHVRLCIYRDNPRRAGRREQISTQQLPHTAAAAPAGFPSFVPEGERWAVNAPLYPRPCTHTHLYDCPAPGGAEPLTHSPPLTAGSAAAGRRGEGRAGGGGGRKAERPDGSCPFSAHRRAS